MIKCADCDYEKNPDDAEYCDACGSELITQTDSGSLEEEIDDEEILEALGYPLPESDTSDDPNFTMVETAAKLVSKQAGSPIAEFPLDSNAVVGIFDPDMGPVDIDLEEFRGNETVSRNHGEISLESGDWKIKDLGSTNGIFIKRTGQTRFGARITVPETINPGDEIAFGKVRFVFQTD